jgi:hypothetical protein
LQNQSPRHPRTIMYDKWNKFEFYRHKVENSIPLHDRHDLLLLPQLLSKLTWSIYNNNHIGILYIYIYIPAMPLFTIYTKLESVYPRARAWRWHRTFRKHRGKCPKVLFIWIHNSQFGNFYLRQQPSLRAWTGRCERKNHG